MDTNSGTSHWTQLSFTGFDSPSRQRMFEELNCPHPSPKWYAPLRTKKNIKKKASHGTFLKDELQPRFFHFSLPLHKKDKIWLIPLTYRNIKFRSKVKSWECTHMTNMYSNAEVKRSCILLQYTFCALAMIEYKQIFYPTHLLNMIWTPCRTKGFSTPIQLSFNTTIPAKVQKAIKFKDLEHLLLLIEKMERLSMNWIKENWRQLLEFTKLNFTKQESTFTPYPSWFANFKSLNTREPHKRGWSISSFDIQRIPEIEWYKSMINKSYRCYRRKLRLRRRKCLRMKLSA